ncbi:hypothetical protein MtrunA17_Chr3g0095381 [Medicago truncatula]|uniref:Transmembrane protein n=1 Tax=Medicago truncatula TaxID=3880 RepID=A0A396IV13_MEDTR|nr:hypothetical protein MtrunA17_Chr3g0095381 [Medicago truncatula]
MLQNISYLLGVVASFERPNSLISSTNPIKLLISIAFHIGLAFKYH